VSSTFEPFHNRFPNNTLSINHGAETEPTIQSCSFRLSPKSVLIQSLSRLLCCDVLDALTSSNRNFINQLSTLITPTLTGRINRDFGVLAIGFELRFKTFLDAFFNLGLSGFALIIC
jgi:hypothetical protein